MLANSKFNRNVELLTNLYNASLTHFSPMSQSIPPENVRNPTIGFFTGFSDVSRGIEM